MAEEQLTLAAMALAGSQIDASVASKIKGVCFNKVALRLVVGAGTIKKLDVVTVETSTEAGKVTIIF